MKNNNENTEWLVVQNKLIESHISHKRGNIMILFKDIYRP